MGYEMDDSGDGMVDAKTGMGVHYAPENTLKPKIRKVKDGDRFLAELRGAKMPKMEQHELGELGIN